tara:strand:+ start:1842 stop:2261 length:420 start_codon:yes stop_codon:yes gene_type:complete
MNANIYEYGADPKTGLKRRLIRDSALVQEEMDTNQKPKAVVFLRLQTYLENNNEIVVVTDVSAGYEVIKGEISYDVNGVALPKHIINPETGEITTPINPDTDEPYPRDNGYDNIIVLSKLPISFDNVLDTGIKEYYGIE